MVKRLLLLLFFAALFCSNSVCKPVFVSYNENTGEKLVGHNIRVCSYDTITFYVEDDETGKMLDTFDITIKYYENNKETETKYKGEKTFVFFNTNVMWMYVPQLWEYIAINDIGTMVYTSYHDTLEIMNCHVDTVICQGDSICLNTFDITNEEGDFYWETYDYKTEIRNYGGSHNPNKGKTICLRPDKSTCLYLWNSNRSYIYNIVVRERPTLKYDIQRKCNDISINVKGCNDSIYMYTYDNNLYNMERKGNSISFSIQTDSYLLVEPDNWCSVRDTLFFDFFRSDFTIEPNNKNLEWCQGESIELKRFTGDSISIDKYEIYTPANTYAQLEDVTEIVGTHTIYLWRTDLNGCSDSAMAFITVRPRPEFDIDNTQGFTLCIGDTLIIRPEPRDSNYLDHQFQILKNGEFVTTDNMYKYRATQTEQVLFEVACVNEYGCANKHQYPYSFVDCNNQCVDDTVYFKAASVDVIKNGSCDFSLLFSTKIDNGCLKYYYIDLDVEDCNGGNENVSIPLVVNGNTVNFESELSVEIFAADGRKVFGGKCKSVKLDTGLYIVTSNGAYRKVLIK